MSDFCGKIKSICDRIYSTGKTVIIITHNSALTQIADRVIRVKNGQATSVETNSEPTPVERIEW